MYSPLTIANYFLQKAWCEDTDLTPVQIVKLVYLSHGWYLGENDTPLIRGRIRAWTYGPAIPELHHHIQEYGRGPITTPIVSPFRAVNDQTVGELDVQFLDVIWAHYKQFSPIQLSGVINQKGSPWDQIASGHCRRELAGRSIPITNATIRDYYKRRIDVANSAG